MIPACACERYFEALLLLLMMFPPPLSASLYLRGAAAILLVSTATAIDIKPAMTRGM